MVAFNFTIDRGTILFSLNQVTHTPTRFGKVVPLFGIWECRVSDHHLSNLCTCFKNHKLLEEFLEIFHSGRETKCRISALRSCNTGILLVLCAVNTLRLTDGAADKQWSCRPCPLGGHLHSLVPVSSTCKKRGVWRKTQVHF